MTVILLKDRVAIIHHQTKTLLDARQCGLHKEKPPEEKAFCRLGFC